MTKEDYQGWVKKMWRGDFADLRNRFIMTAGLGGETGEVLELLKKEVRDDKEIHDDLLLELGDVLYYLTMITISHGFNLEDVIYANVKKLTERYNKNKEVA